MAALARFRPVPLVRAIWVRPGARGGSHSWGRGAPRLRLHAGALGCVACPAGPLATAVGLRIGGYDDDDDDDYCHYYYCYDDDGDYYYY